MELPELPPLPAVGDTTERVEVWGLMHDYARAAVLAERERCAQLCDAIEIELWDRYKRGTGQERGSDYAQGESAGACSCAAAIRKVIEAG